MKLPDYKALGGLPAVEGSRRTPSYSTDGFVADTGKGLRDLGAGIASAGNSLQRKAAQTERRTDALERANADADFQIRTMRLRSQVASGSDFEKAPGAFREGAMTALEESSKAFSDPKERAMFRARTMPRIEREAIEVQSWARGKQFEVAVTDATDRLGELRKVGLAATDDKERVRVIGAGGGIIDGLRDAGLVDERQAEKMRKGWVENYQADKYLQMPPRERLKMLQQGGDTSGRQSEAMQFFQERGWSKAQASGIVGNLVQESRPDLDSKAVHDGGIGLGIAGWNGSRLVALKQFAKEQGTAPTDFKTQLEFLDTELRGPEHTAFSALSAAKTPQEAARAMLHYERPRGYQPNSPESGHGFTNRVNNAVRLFGAGEGARSEAPTDFLSPQRRSQLIDQTIGDIAQEDRAIEQDRRTAEIDGLSQLAGGKLTREWIDENAPRLGAGATRLSQALEVEPAVREHFPISRALRTGALNAPEDAIQEAVDAYVGRSITPETLGDTVRLAQSSMTDKTARPWANELRRDVASRLEGKSDKQFVALSDFNEWLTSNPTADQKTAQERATELLQRHADLDGREKRERLSLPRFTLADRLEMTPQEVAALREKTIDAAANGLISLDDLFTQASLLDDWSSAFGPEVA